MIKRFFTRFGEWPTTHFFCIGMVWGLIGPHPDEFLKMGFLMALLGSMIWWPLKALFITASTVANWDTTRDGPMFKAGGLTEYDSEFARQVGGAAAKASRLHDRENQ